MQIFLMQYYSDQEQVTPEMVIVDMADEEIESFSAALNQVSGGEQKISVFGRKKKYLPLIEMCRKHAEESQRQRLTQEDSPFVGLNKLKELLQLKELPRHLECYDIAIWQGTSPTASQVVSIDGKLDKTLYRHYHMQELPEGNNDFAMMREVIMRRLKHGRLPDVFVIDGGVAQVNTVLSVLRELKQELPVVGIAKSRDLVGDFQSSEIQRSEERLIIPGRKDPYILSKNKSLMKIIVSLRDEAHRFSRRLHHKTENKRVLQTWLDEVEGLSEKAWQQILKNLTVTQRELTHMNADQIARLLGVDLKVALKLARHLSRALDSKDKD
jgi:excinuclease ABC subunit C